MKKVLLILPLLILILFSCNKKKRNIEIIKGRDFQKALTFLYHQNDSAFYYFNEVVSGSKDSLLIATSYNYMSVIQSDAGDYFGSEESLLNSLKYLDKEETKYRACLSSDYNELGLTTMNLKNYPEALNFYNLALKFADNKNFRTIILNNKALALQKKGDYEQALHLYRSILPTAVASKVEYARVLSNMGRTRWLQNPKAKTAPELLKALQLRIDAKDEWGQNASFSHLADYYARSHPDSALYYANHMYQIAKHLRSPDDELEALQKIIKLSTPQAAQQYFNRYQNIDDSLQTARNAAKNQFALIRYDVQKSKADNLKLQKDNTDKKYQIFRQKILLYTIVLALFTSGFITIAWYRKRKEQLAWELHNKIREHELKTSQKVHDVVANGLYRVMAEIEYQDFIDKDHLLNKIEVLYEQSRDISYERQQDSDEEFHKKLGSMLMTFSTAERRVLVVGNHDNLWVNVNSSVRFEITHVMQELMVNMKKHSQASTVVIRFKKVNSDISINYSDDGKGLPARLVFGNGLTNTGNRIKGINGNINFENGREKGCEIQISFPVI